MNLTQDIRWIQRLNNYHKALNQLRKFIAKGELNELEEQGLIQAFEYTHELAWNTLKDFLESRGNQAIYGSRDATREAFKLGLLEDGEGWMDMIQSRNKTSHTYNEDTAKEIVNDILTRYFLLFEQLREAMERLKVQETG
jgi:nucleotidyltransferase substrate binding protein (TIGR01987 family)